MMGLTVEDITPAIALAFGKRSSVRQIQTEVAQFYGIDPVYMSVPDRIGSREPRISHPRQVAMFFAQKLTGLPSTEIGRRFNRDHSTVLHAKKAVEQRAASDPYLEMELEVLRDRLSNSHSCASLPRTTETVE